jgi:NhaP-type Na+/H+ or K+/H+ antiporter
VSPWLLLLLACLTGTASGVVTSLLSEKTIRASERARYRKETLDDLEGR